MLRVCSYAACAQVRLLPDTDEDRAFVNAGTAQYTHDPAPRNYSFAAQQLETRGSQSRASQLPAAQQLPLYRGDLPPFRMHGHTLQ